MEVAYKSRARLHQSICGDGIFIHQTQEEALIAVMDGVGHGPHAARAVQEAQSFLHAHLDKPLVELLKACDQAIIKTVGISVALLHIQQFGGQMRHAAVGNVEVICLTRPELQPHSIPGIVGGRYRKAIERQFSLQKGDILLAHTDGIRRDVTSVPYRDLEPQDIAEIAIEEYGKEQDDATCLVIRY